MSDGFYQDPTVEDVEMDRDEWNRNYDEKYEATLELLRANGFHPEIIHLGDTMFSVFSTTSRAAACLRCYCLVVICDLKGGGTSIEAHSKQKHFTSNK